MMRRSRSTNEYTIKLLTANLTQMRGHIAEGYKFSKFTCDFWLHQYERVASCRRGTARQRRNLLAEIAVLLALNCSGEE